MQNNNNKLGLVLNFAFFVITIILFSFLYSNYTSTINYFGPLNSGQNVWLHPKNTNVLRLDKVVQGTGKIREVKLDGEYYQITYLQTKFGVDEIKTVKFPRVINSDNVFSYNINDPDFKLTKVSAVEYPSLLQPDTEINFTLVAKDPYSNNFSFIDYLYISTNATEIN